MPINYDLLFHLGLNARESSQSLGKKIKKSQQYVSYNLQKYESEGIVEGFTTLFDYSRFDYLVFSVYFKVIYSNQKQYEAMIRELLNDPSVISITELDGVSDLLLEIAAKNPSAFNKSFKEIITRFRSQLQSYQILLEVVKHVYPRTYMPSKVNQEEISQYRDRIVGADREPYELPPQMKHICHYLLEYPRIPLVDIAREIQVSPKTVMMKLRELERLKIIRGYIPILNPSKAGIVHKKLFLELFYQDVNQEKELMMFLKEYEHVIEVTKTIGKWDMIIDVEAFNQERFRKVFLTIRERLKSILREIEVKGVDRIYKSKFLPGIF